MAILSQADVHRMLGSTQPMSLSNTYCNGWSVQALCTGTALLSERRLCVVGCCLDGHWFRPPAYFTNKMILLILLPKTENSSHHSIVNVPYKQVIANVVTVYKVLVTELFALGVSSYSSVFLGVSAGVLSTMVLLTSLMTDKAVQMQDPIAVFIAGAWHPRAHPQFRKAILSLDLRDRPQVFVINHTKDYFCTWPEQDAFWHELKSAYQSLILVVLDYQGSAAAELFDKNYHALGGRLAASTQFWNWLLGENVSNTELEQVATIACDWNIITCTAPFPGFAHSLGLRILCRLWRHMRIPDVKQPDWALQLFQWMQHECATDCSQMLHDECLSNWPTCLDSSKLGEYYLSQLCNSFANSFREGVLHSLLNPIPVSFKHLHHSEDMELVEVKFDTQDQWLSTSWTQGSERKVDNTSIIFTHPCIIVLRFSSGACFIGFYHSHLKHTSSKRQADGKNIYDPQSLKTLVVACTPEAFDVCGKAVTNCVGIEVVQLTSLMGIGSLGRMIFPPDEKFHAWIAEIDATTQLPASHSFDDSEHLHVLDSLSFPSELKKM